MNWVLFFLYILIHLTCYSHSTFDLNIHHLQYVSDSLTIDECRQLISLLETIKEEISLHLRPNIYGIVDNLFNDRINKLTLSNKRQFTNCILELVHWNHKHTNSTETFHLLKDHLIYLHHDDIAQRLTRSVNNEVVRDVKHFMNQISNYKHPSNEENPIEEQFKSAFELTNQLPSSFIRGKILFITGVFLSLFSICSLFLFVLWILTRKKSSYINVRIDWSTRKNMCFLQSNNQYSQFYYLMKIDIRFDFVANRIQ